MQSLKKLATKTIVDNDYIIYCNKHTQTESRKYLNFLKLENKYIYCLNSKKMDSLTDSKLF